MNRCGDLSEPFESVGVSTIIPDRFGDISPMVCLGFFDRPPFRSVSRDGLRGSASSVTAGADVVSAFDSSWVGDGGTGHWAAATGATQPAGEREVTLPWPMLPSGAVV